MLKIDLEGVDESLRLFLWKINNEKNLKRALLNTRSFTFDLVLVENQKNLRAEATPFLKILSLPFVFLQKPYPESHHTYTQVSKSPWTHDR